MNAILFSKHFLVKEKDIFKTEYQLKTIRKKTIIIAFQIWFRV